MCNCICNSFFSLQIFNSVILLLADVIVLGFATMHECTAEATMHECTTEATMHECTAEVQKSRINASPWN